MQDDARNLSGGERSFTTLAFELSMWEFCETPFRVLDEFDVYMDDTYRKIAVDTLLALCDGQPRKQFIFVTPQVARSGPMLIISFPRPQADFKAEIQSGCEMTTGTRSPQDMHPFLIGREKQPRITRMYDVR